jgi:hypothetical protein
VMGEVDGNRSELCAMMSFGTSSIQPLGSANSVSYKYIISLSYVICLLI